MNMISKVARRRRSSTPAHEDRRPSALATRRASSATPLIALAAAVTFWSSDPSPAAAPPLPSVTVAAPLQSEVNLWDDYVGRFEASRSVEVRPRVSGADRRRSTSPTARSSGRASCSSPSIRGPSRRRSPRREPASRRPRANWRWPQLNLGRARRLLEADAVSQANVDQLTAQVQTARAALAAAQARVRQRALDVEFTRVRAPIGGRISDRRIDAGNLVSAGVDGGTLLTTINALDPIYFTFDVPESLYLKDARQRREGGRRRRGRDPAAGRGRVTTGAARLDFTDNGISQNSGTVRARAVVRQPGLFPDARHVRQHAPRRRRDRRLRCSSPTRPSAPTRRARSC